MSKRGFSQKEKKVLLSFVFGVIAWSFLGDPIDKLINAIVPNLFIKVILGLAIVGGFLYWFRLD